MLIDISNWQHPFPAKAAAVDGVTEVIVGCQRPGIAKSMIADCKAAGISVIGVYAFLYWGTDTLGQTRAAINVAKEYGISRVWLDCENSDDESQNATPQSRISELLDCVSAVESEGLNAGIYTYGPWWRSSVANTTRFKHLPLWFANYGPNGTPQVPIETVSFGGWTDVGIHQFTSVYPLPKAGMHVDANYKFMEEDDVTREEFEEFKEKTNARLYQLETQAWGEGGVPRSNEKPYAPMNMYDLATGRTMQAAAQSGPRVFKVAGTLEEVQ